MSTCETNVVTCDCTSFDDLCAQINKLPQCFPSRWIYRGESSARYTLLPSLLRENAYKRIARFLPDKDLSDRSGLSVYEAKLVTKFAKIANQQGLYITSRKEFMLYDGDMAAVHLTVNNKILSEDLYELFALAQHYGIPTRFLDWTYDMYVACFFALRNAYEKILQAQNNDKIILWAINMGFLQMVYDKTKLYFVTPRYANNPNLAAQKGVLSFYDNIEENTPLDKKIEKIQLKNERPLLYRFTLPYAEVPLSFYQLYKAGYTYSRIFPGYASIAKEIQELNELVKGCRALDAPALQAWKEKGDFADALEKIRKGVSQ